MNPFLNRKYVIGGIFGLIILIFVTRLFFLQVVNQSYKASASNNVLRYVTQYPARGLIYDRNGKLLVYNEAAYDLMVIPNQTEQFDTLELAEMLGISCQQIEEGLKKAKIYSRYKPSVFVKQISAKNYALIQEKLYMYKGFFAQTRSLRRYPEKSAAHILGYVGEVDENTANKNKYYNPGDYIGISGVEKSYEKVLRGKKGVEIFMVDVHNRIKGRYKKGRYDTASVHGANIKLTIDSELQKYGELLMTNKIGSIVALEPATGEILAMVSSPSYNPELLIGRVRTENYLKLEADTLKPLFNRPLMARYPPGSTFKTVNALIGLQEKVIFPYTKFTCSLGYSVGSYHMGCHNHKRTLKLDESIQNSCNAYYAAAFRLFLDHPKYKSFDNSFKVWRDYLLSFGFDKKLGVDLPNEKSGYIPSLDYFKRIHGGRPKSLHIVSMAIGQGELLMTPIQMANMAAIICNKGSYYTPHVIKTLPSQFNEMQQNLTAKKYTKIDTVNFIPVIEGMYKAVNEHGGTALNASIKDIKVCGKTGTAQNPHGEDHSIFIAFAPKDNPQIVLAVYVENGGYGTRWAAPIASFMIEKYLTDTVTKGWYEDYVLNANLLDVRKKE